VARAVRTGRAVAYTLILGICALSPAAGQPPATPASPAGAKPPPVRMQVEVGYGGCIRVNRAAPVRVTFDNDGDGIQGRLVVRAEEGLDQTEMEVALPKGAHKQYAVLVTPRGADDSEGKWSVSARLLGGRRAIVAQTVTAQSLSPETVLVLSITGESSGLQFLDGAELELFEPPQPRKLRCVHLAPPDLPTQWLALAPVDLVVLNGRAWTALDAPQRRAVRQWVELGGWPEEASFRRSARAILCGELPTEWRDADGAALAAVDPARVMTPARLQSLASSDWCGRAFAPGGGAGVLTVTGPPRGEGSPALLEEEGAALARSRVTLDGATLWFGFDPFRQTFRQWELAPRFWHRAMQEAMKARPRWAPSLTGIDVYESARQAAVSIPKLPAPPTGAIVTFACVYAIVFGPMNIGLLRRLRRTVRAWLLMPALALAMTLALLVLGQSWGSDRTILNTLTMVETCSGARAARQQTIIGLFSPTNRAFDVLIEDPAPVFQHADSLEAASTMSYSRSDMVEWPTRQEDGRVRFDRQAQALYSILGRRVTRAVELGGSITAQVLPDGRIEVRNDSVLNPRGSYLSRAGSRRDLGDLPPGARRVVGAEGWRKLPADRNGAATPAADGQGFAGATRTLFEGAAELVPSARGASGWLVAELPEYDPAVRLEGIPGTNRFALLLVRIAEANR
jgi:hypothetical protein